MMGRRLFVIISMLFALNVHARQSDICFRQLTAGDGLSDNRVLSIGMGDDGVLCIRTDTKIDRYDGASFRHFGFESGHVGYNSYPGVFPLQFDGFGRLWMRNQDMIWGLDFNSGEWIYDVKKPLGLSFSAEVSSLFIDSDKNYWIWTSERDFFLVQSVSGETLQVGDRSMGSPRGMVDSRYLCWILYEDNTLRCYDKQDRRFVSEIEDFIADDRIERLKMKIDPDGNLWVMYNQGLMYLDTHSGIRRNIGGIELHGDGLLTSMDIDGHSNVWLGSTGSGLMLVDSKSFVARPVPLILCSGAEISTMIGISDIFVDPNDIVWIATSKEGVLYHHDGLVRLEKINSETVSKGIFEENIKAILPMRGGNLLLGTASGVYEYRVEDNSVHIPRWLEGLKSELCTGLYMDSRGDIWVSTFQNGSFRVSSGGVRHYIYDKSLVHLNYYKGTPYMNSSRTFFEDSDGTLWVSVYGGIGKMDTETGHISLLAERHPEIAHIKFVRNILQIDNDRLLVAADDCVFEYIPSVDSVVFNPDSQLFVGRITKHNCTIVDSRSLVWFGTHDGLSVHEKSGLCLAGFGGDDGMPENILGLAEDRCGNIWVSTPVAVARIAVTLTDDGKYAFSTTLLDETDGLDNSTFYEHSAAVGADGRIYFGGTHGLTVADPDDFMSEAPPSVPRLCGLYLFNDRLAFEIGAPVKLRHSDNALTFEMSGMNYLNPSRTWYRYRLQGYDDRWTEMCCGPSPARASYAKLRPGNYSFVFYTASEDGQWSENPGTLEICISRPPWRSLPMLMLYLLVSVAAAWFSAGKIKVAKARRKEEERRVAESERLADVEKMKMRFFTNVSHELRTPLTLILTPLESMMNDSGLSVQHKEKLAVVERNAKTLLALVNQLLDFRRLESGKERLVIRHGRIDLFIKDVFSRFIPEAEKRMVSYDLDIKSEMVADFDAEKLRKIIVNLLSNSFKFTPSGGSIRLEASWAVLGEGGKRMLKIVVSDTGRGVPEQDLDNIFERFYQAGGASSRNNEGTGIGLHMVKEYVGMMGGRIDVKSTVGSGTVFTVLLDTEFCPDGESVVEEHVSEDCGIQTEDTGQGSGRNEYAILVVDDNEDFRHYLVDELQKKYVVFEAADGETGFKVASSNMVDLVISDVMMPVMDGLEFCKKLKTTLTTSHIPVILLSARVTDSDKMSGFESGADEYVEKPFNMEILNMRIRNLIQKRQERIENFRKSAIVNQDGIELTSIDREFLKKAQECVENNISNPEMSVEMLSSELGMHRMSLYRKLVSIVGQNPALFIRTIRLKYAARLLREDGSSIADVAYLSGFNSPQVFSKYFKEQYGFLPSQYVEKNK